MSFITYLFAERIQLATETDKEFVKAKFMMKDKKLHVQQNWVDTDKFKPGGMIRTKSILFDDFLSLDKRVQPPPTHFQTLQYRKKYILANGESLYPHL